MKIQATDKEKIFENYRSHKGLVSLYMKNSENSVIRKTQSNKMDKTFEHCTRRYTESK